MALLTCASGKWVRTEYSASLPLPSLMTRKTQSHLTGCFARSVVISTLCSEISKSAPSRLNARDTCRWYALSEPTISFLNRMISVPSTELLLRNSQLAQSVHLLLSGHLSASPRPWPNAYRLSDSSQPVRRVGGQWPVDKSTVDIQPSDRCRIAVFAEHAGREMSDRLPRKKEATHLEDILLYELRLV